jgi:hypothetical protein
VCEIESMTDLTRRDTALRLNPDVIAKRLDQAIVLVHIATNRIFELNETGARVWELLGQGLDADRIARHLIDEFDVDDVRAADELKDLLMQLQAEGLLTS